MIWFRVSLFHGDFVNSLAYLNLSGKAFQALLPESGDWRPSISGMDFETLNRQNAVKLEEPFTKEEVFNALSALNRDKALGPDSFSMAFW